MEHQARIICDGKSLLWAGHSIHIDHDAEFVTRKRLPLVASVITFGGRTFDIYMGKARSRLGTMCDLASAVETTPQPV